MASHIFPRDNMFGGRNMATLIIIKGDQEMGEIYYVIFACFKKPTSMCVQALKSNILQWR